MVVTKAQGKDLGWCGELKKSEILAANLKYT